MLEAAISVSLFRSTSQTRSCALRMPRYVASITFTLQIGNMSLNTCIDFILQQELIQKYNYDKSQPGKQIFADAYMLKKEKNVCIFVNMKKKGKLSCICEDL